MGGGTYIFIQNVEGSPIFARRQVSTDISRVEFAENSITSAVDFTAKFFRNQLRPYIGRFNITKTYLEQLSQISDGICNSLVEDGVLSDCAVSRIEQDDVAPDKVEIDVVLSVFFPANKILVTLII